MAGLWLRWARPAPCSCAPSSASAICFAIESVIHRDLKSSNRYVFLKASGEFGVNVFRVDVATGHAEVWRTLAPSDVAGVRYPTYSLAMTPDGQSYCYSYGRRLSALFVVNGLK